MKFNTKRLEIRPFKLSDKERTFEIYKDEETNRYLLHDAGMNRILMGNFKNV